MRNACTARSAVHHLVASAALAGVFGAVSISAPAEALIGSPIIFRSGDWAVHRTQDSMTDASICTAIYRDNYDIQLGSHLLAIAIGSGIKSVTLRFDNENAQETRLAKRSELAISALNIEGADFQHLRQSSRLRYRVLTGLDTVVEGDIDLTGMTDAYKNIQSGCVGDPVAAVNR